MGSTEDHERSGSCTLGLLRNEAFTKRVWNEAVGQDRTKLHSGVIGSLEKGASAIYFFCMLATQVHVRDKGNFDFKVIGIIVVPYWECCFDCFFAVF